MRSVASAHALSLSIIRVERGSEGDMHKLFTAMVGFAAILAATGSAMAAEKTMNLSRNAKSGADSRLAYSGRWDRNCNS
jgi:hypothetical protein